MPPTSEQLYTQMQEIAKQAAAYTPTAAGDIYRDLAKRVGFFEPQYKELREQEAQAYALPATMMKQYREQYPEPGIGPGALTQLESIMRSVGRGYGTADVMADVLGASRGRIENLAQDVLGQYQAAQQALLSRYGMLSPLYQTAVQTEESARQRAFQQQQEEAARQWQAQQAELEWQRQLELENQRRAASSAAAAQQRIAFEEMLGGYQQQMSDWYNQLIEEYRKGQVTEETPQVISKEEAERRARELAAASYTPGPVSYLPAGTYRGQPLTPESLTPEIFAPGYTMQQMLRGMPLF